MNESSYWKGIRRSLRGKGHFDRIENDVAAGRPDVNYCVQGFEGNIELKYRVKAPVRPSTMVFPKGKGLRPSQVVWIIERVHHGGVVFLLAGVGRRGFMIRMTAEVARGFNSLTIMQLESLNLLQGKPIDQIILEAHHGH